MKPYDWKKDYDWTDPDDYPVGEDDEVFELNEEELMLPHEIKAPGGIGSLDKRQASGIGQDVLIEKIVEEFVRRKGRKPRSIEEIKEFYFQEMAGGAGGSGEPQRVAYNPGDYDPMIVDEYEKYKGSQEEQGGPVITIDEFLMETRAGVRAGGLPGILGI
tara:strand:- start:5 stop:484 length:480 start_codon:yes stop_codon:yes gene_type:complete